MCISIFVDVTYSLSKLSGESRWILRFSEFRLCSKSRGTGEEGEYCGILEDAITEASVSNWFDAKDVSPNVCWTQEIHI